MRLRKAKLSITPEGANPKADPPQIVRQPGGSIKPLDMSLFSSPILLWRDFSEGGDVTRQQMTSHILHKLS